MKATKAYFVISNAASSNYPQKIAGVFWTQENAKKYAWQLTTESAEGESLETFSVETRKVTENIYTKIKSGN